MEVVPAVQMNDNSPFQRRDVAEWSHMDRLTGMMETARVETDRWAASTSTTAHAYGKVVDSRNRSLPDGSAQQRQRQQLEVFQTKGPGGSLQVIRTQSVTSTNSSWRGSSLMTGGRAPLPAITQDFGNLQLTLNPLDLTSEKCKGSVGRSGSIGGRRPPSRPRSLIGKVVTPLAIEENDGGDAGRRLVTRICQQVAEEEVKRPNISSIRELTSSISSRSSSSQISNGHSNISRKKSSSIEDLHNGTSEERTDEEDGLKRSSKVRRSLQFPLKKLEARGGVGKLLQELEESNKRNTADGRIARKSFEALENVLKRGNNIFDTLNKSETEDSDSLEVSNKASVNNISLDSFSKKFAIAKKRHSYVDTLNRNEEESSTDEGKNKSPATKRHSFVTVESLKEVRGRLKRLNSPLDGLDVESGVEEIEDDGIGTDESTTKPSVMEVPPTRVKSYVYGMEAISNGNRVPMPGTGSLESRTSNKNGTNGCRSDEWYNRRKSYGFEQVTGEHANDSSSTLSSKGDESKLESTDSGICRSSEMFNMPSWSRKSATNAWNNSELSNVAHNIQIKSRNSEDNSPNEEREVIEKRRTSVVNFGSEEKSQQHVTVSIPIVQDEESPTVGSRRLFYQQLAQGTTVSVEKAKKPEPTPSITATRLVGDDWWMKPNRTFGDEDWQVPSKLLSSAMKRHSFAGDNSWKQLNGNDNNLEVMERTGESWRRLTKPVDIEMKRHSIAVDERKYVKDGEPISELVSYAQHDDNMVSKKHKKVEFCKTEVHFAAEPGRFNIVETDEKPPSTNMFRRRRRQTNPTPDPVKNSNLPEVRFGDSIYEKQLLTRNEDVPSVKAPVRPTSLRLSVQEDDDQVYSLDKPSYRDHTGEVENEEENNMDTSPDSKPRSILKNYTKPHSDEGNLIDQDQEEQDEKWGVRLRPVTKDTPSPVWKSTVTVSSRDAVMPLEYSGQSELQKLLRSLRPANQRKHDLLLAARNNTKTTVAMEKVSDWSVAERIRHVEQVASETKGFSTRVNFGGGEATVVSDEQTSPLSQRLFQISDRPKPVWQRREEALIASGYADPADNLQGPLHSSVATTNLQSYGESSRLRAVETMVSTKSGHPKITSIALRYDGDQNNQSTKDLADSFKYTSRTTISPERRHSSYHESETVPRPKENISSSTFLEPPYKSQSSSFLQKESNTNSVKSLSYSSSRERHSYCDSEHNEKSQEKSLSNMISTFEKQHFNPRRSQSPPVHNSLSSSRMVSSFDRKVSSSPRRSQSPELTLKQSPLNKRSSPRIEDPAPLIASSRERKYNSYDSPTIATEAKQSYESSSCKRHVDIRSRATSTQVQCEVGTVIKATSPSPVKKVTSPSKNSSVNKDFIGRVGSESPVYQNKVSNTSSSKSASLKDITQVSARNGTRSPIYQNKEVYSTESCSRARRSKQKAIVEPEIKLTECGLDADETDSAILEELTRAADQILQAVNGYTDEESRRASSEDEHTRRIRERRILGTISEAPSTVRKTTDTKGETVKTNGVASRRTQRTSSKTKLGPTSSTSSVESFTREAPRKVSNKTDRGSSTTSNRSATSSRTARMVQRASSRELLLQAHASSSEDVASGTESKKPRAPPPRRSRTSSNSNKLPTTKSTDVQKDPNSSRSTRERASVSKTKSRDATISSYEGRRKTPETKQYPIKEKTIPGVGSMSVNRERTSSSRKSTTATRTKKSSSSRNEVLSSTKREQVK